MKIPLETILLLLAVIFLAESVGAAPAQGASSEKLYLRHVVEDFTVTKTCPRTTIAMTIVCEVMEDRAMSMEDGLSYYEQRFADTCCFERE